MIKCGLLRATLRSLKTNRYVPDCSNRGAQSILVIVWMRWTDKLAIMVASLSDTSFKQLRSTFQPDRCCRSVDAFQNTGYLGVGGLVFLIPAINRHTIGCSPSLGPDIAYRDDNALLAKLMVE